MLNVEIMSEQPKTIDDIQMDETNLYREETITDLKTGTIKILSPIKKDGSPDDSRKPVYMCHTELMSNAGPIPVNATIDAANLSEAVDKFPAAVKQAVDEMMQRVQEYQREQANRIVTPDEMAGGGMGGKPGGGIIV